MPVTFTATRALLSTMATTLSAEATSVGLTSLATGLTNLSTEITNNSSITEQEFFGGGSTSFTASGGSGGATPSGGSASGSGSDRDSAALVWSSMLDTAANIITSRNSNITRDLAVNNDSTQGIVSIAYSLGMIENSLSTIADKQSAMETYQKALKELSETTGLKVRSPFEAFGMVSIYKLLIEEAAVLQSEKVPDAKKDEALRTIKYYIDKINASQFKEF